MFKVHIKDTDLVTVSLLPALNNVQLRDMFKILKCSMYTKVQNRMIKTNGNDNEKNNHNNKDDNENQNW